MPCYDTCLLNNCVILKEKKSYEILTRETEMSEKWAYEKKSIVNLGFNENKTHEKRN